MSTPPDHTSVRQLPAILALCLICLALNVILLWDFHPRLAGRNDDNTAYYARRAVVQDQFPGDLFHNHLQQEYIWLSAPNWLSYLLVRFFGIEPHHCGFFL